MQQWKSAPKRQGEKKHGFLIHDEEKFRATCLKKASTNTISFSES